ncbi:endopeptidase La [bacterium NHP-B]|nr:endopeptidase La [bacterium NHP-B]
MCLTQELEEGFLSVLALRDIVVFPHMVVPLFIGRDKSVQAIRSVDKTREVVLLTQKDPLLSKPSVDGLFEVGTLATVIQVLTLADGTIKALVRGGERVRVKEFGPDDDFFQVKTAPFETIIEGDTVLEPLKRTLLSEFDHFIRLNRKGASDILGSINQIEDSCQLVDTIAGHMPLRNLRLKQNLLEEVSLAKRMELLIGYIDSEVEMHQAEKRIKNRIRSQVEQNHREYILNEQMKAIQRELGEGEDDKNDFSVLEKQIESTKLSKEARVKAKSELKKLKNMNPMSAEASVIRNYLETLLALPWGKYTRLQRNLSKAEDTLNKDHYGLKKIKERILEYLAVGARVEKIKGPILCLVGPPGVGKTSLGKSIAKATGRKFVRIALGGVQDEAEIRGHRRTYIGSMPGKILQALKKAQTSDPLILLDEIDKLGSSWRRDPVSALLEVLDPEQNEHFQDHYLELGFDLSRVMFVTTANSAQMHPALLDRMETVSLAGYMEDEKVHIAQKHLIPRQKTANGLKKGEFTLSEKAIRTLIRNYCREAGVRNLERVIASLARKTVRLIDKGKIKRLNITTQNLEKHAGVPRFHTEEAGLENAVGVTKGLAWTEVGGELLHIEALMLPGKGRITATGKLGEVMQESIRAASSFVRARAIDYGVKPTVFETRDIHVHVPEGATPKDGPSAGVAMCTSIVSVLTGIPVRGDVAMTGEISLRGRVLPIGGVREKLLAAHRSCLTTVLIPKDNERDLKDIPSHIKRGLDIVLVSRIDDVLKRALSKPLTPVAWTAEDQRLFDEHLSTGRSFLSH